MTDEIRPEQRLTILKHLANGKGIDVVASIIHLDKELVRRVAQSHGYPDREKLSWAVDVVTKNIEDGRAIPTSTLPQGNPETRIPRPAQVTAASPTPAASVASQRPDEFRVLIDAAHQSEKKRIQALADKILDDCAKLRGLLERETKQDQLKRQIEAEKERARAEVERLEKQLADAKAKLRGGRSASGKKAEGATTPKGDYPCRNQPCTEHYDTPQGRSMHERMHCEHRAEAAAS